MRICLINPPNAVPKTRELPKVFQPLGLAYIASVLESRHNVHIIDALAEGYEEIRQENGRHFVGLEYGEISERIREISPHIVGIAVPFSAQAQCAVDVARAIKRVDRDTITILGGVHPSVRPIQCLTNPHVDYVVVGEGEHTIVELVDVLEREDYDQLKKVQGIGFKKDGKPAVTPSRPLIEDLDSIPFPARHLLPMDIYFKLARRGYVPRHGLSRRWATVTTSRGCPYKCVFCSIHNTMGRVWRSRSPENVVREIEQLAENYKIKQIDFEDDNMTLNRKRMERICDLLIERGLDIEWYTPNGVRADTLDERLLRKMKKSGLKGIWISPESGVQRVVNQIIKKNLDLRQVEKVVSLCRKLRINVECYFVVGVIGETKEDIKSTISYSRRLKGLGATGVQFCIATPYYGTELYERARDCGYLHKSFSDETSTVSEANIETPDFTMEEIRELYKVATRPDPILTRMNVMRVLRNPKLAADFLSRRVKHLLFERRIQECDFHNPRKR